MPRGDAFATKLLFICSRNRMRSLTAEKIFSGIPGYDVRSAGTQPQARIVVNEGHLRWADIIFVMEKAQRTKLRRRFGRQLKSARVNCLDIPDNYGFMDAELVRLLEQRVSRYLP